MTPAQVHVMKLEDDQTRDDEAGRERTMRNRRT